MVKNGGGFDVKINVDVMYRCFVGFLFVSFMRLFSDLGFVVVTFLRWCIMDVHKILSYSATCKVQNVISKLQVLM